MVKAIVILCGMIFLLALLFPTFAAQQLALSPRPIRPWQLATAMFLHSDILHFVFNMLALWFFGTAVESTIGPKRFVKYILLCGMGANTLWWTLAYLQGAQTYALGFSGAVWGLLYAFQFFFPDRIILAFFLFPMRARSFVLIFGGIEIFMALGTRGDGVAHLIHIGGALIGALYLLWTSRYAGATGDWLKRTRHRAFFKWKTRHLTVIKGGKDNDEEQIDDAIDDAIIEKE